jgi:prepilin-type N-terminal cleavage/methylation domain-containing protein
MAQTGAMGHHNPRRGFTLLELITVLGILGLIAAIAIPVVSRVRKDADYAEFVTICQTFAQATEQFMLERGADLTDGDFVDSGSGRIPEGMEPYIKASLWNNGHCKQLGGRWDFDDDWGFFGIGTDNPDVSDAELLRIDEQWDDGNLDTGRLRQTRNGRFYYVIMDLDHLDL